MQNQVNAFIRQVSIIHLALCSGPGLFLLVSLVLHQTQQVAKSADASTIELLWLMVPLIALGGLSASVFLFKMLLEKAREKETLAQKLAAYQGALLLRYATLEGPALLAGVAYFLSGEMSFLAMGLVLVGIMVLLRPSVQKTQEDLRLI